jgi:hypothetical protein
MYEYKVGALYNENRTQWEEGSEYNWRSGIHEIRLFFRNPKPIEVQAVKQGEATFGLLISEDVILLAFKFGSIPWSDASYTIHRVPEHERTLPPLEIGPNERQLMTIFLVDAGTGMLLAIRQVSLSHDFTVALHKAINEQAHRPFDQVIYDRHLHQLYSQYESKALFKLSKVTCKGGD